VRKICPEVDLRQLMRMGDGAPRKNDGSWSLFNVDEGKFCLPLLRDDGVAEESYTGLTT
jgi:hypothetical protein